MYIYIYIYTTSCKKIGTFYISGKAHYWLQNYTNQGSLALLVKNIGPNITKKKVQKIVAKKLHSGSVIEHCIYRGYFDTPDEFCLKMV